MRTQVSGASQENSKWISMRNVIETGKIYEETSQYMNQ